jgi:hypothetical protein
LCAVIFIIRRARGYAFVGVARGLETLRFSL